MINRKTISLSLSFIIILISSMNLNHSLSFDSPLNTKDNNLNDYLPLSAASSAIVDIQSDVDFITLGYAGNGTESSPYLIEDYYIEASFDIAGIRVQNTTKHFIIRNCTIIGIEDLWEGITIVSAAVNTTVIEDCTVINTIWGYGITVQYSYNSTVRNCSLYHSGAAIVVYDSANTLIENNYVKDCGIRIQISNGLQLLNNIVENGGISFSYASTINYSTIEIESNTVNGKILGFFVFEDNLLIESDYGQLILVGCSNIHIKDIEIANVSYAISFLNCTEILVENCILRYNGYGISLKETKDTIITSSTFEHNTFGIYMRSCFGFTVKNNICNYNRAGIYSSKLENSTIKNNNCSYNWETGIWLRTVLYASTVFNNTCYQNEVGISAENLLECRFLNNSIEKNSLDGFSTYHSASSNYSFNIIKDNGKVGMDFDDSYTVSSYNQITYNSFENNAEYGLNLQGGYDYFHLRYEGVTDSMIHHNMFISNNLGGSSQAKDTGNNNTWYDESTQEGNYWDDLGDRKEYPIDGGSIDKYPLNRVPIESPTTRTNLFAISFVTCLVLVSLTSRKRKLVKK